MKKLLSAMVALIMMASLLATTVSAAPAAFLTPTADLGQLKVCKVAGSGVVEGTQFSFLVNGITYNVPAGPADRNGYCVLAGQYPVDTQVTVEEAIPSGYYVSRIEVKPDRSVSKDVAGGVVTVQIVSGVVEVIFTNKVAGSPTPTRTPTSVETSTPRPTNTPANCDPNCTPTSTPVPMGRLQICKEAEGSGVTGSFNFRFETRSRAVPVGACAGLIAVSAGTLTITEDQQAGYTVADIYTIPADRLISKDVSRGSARVRIVEGTAVSQTIVIFRNRSVTTGSFTPTFTPTSTATATPTITGSTTTTVTSTGTLTSTATATPTFTSTGTITPTTITPTVCAPIRVTADFSRVPVGQSVEGMGRVAPDLDIRAVSPGNPNAEAVRVSQVQQPEVFFAPNDIRTNSGVLNGGLVADGGFTDVSTRNLGQAHEYNFIFADGKPVSNFTLHMLDFGDFNPSRATSHRVTMIGYDASGNVIPTAVQELRYTTPADINPRSSPEYGDLYMSGDAVWALGDGPGGTVQKNPGNWVWNISGNAIAKVVLAFPEGYDPRVAFDLLSYTSNASCACQSGATVNYAADFSKVGIGQSVEGLGTVGPFLNIEAISEVAPGEPTPVAVRVSQAQAPVIYFGPNGEGTQSRNGGLVADGGFSDVSARNLRKPHKYMFTFEGVTISSFSLQMLDFGDLNPSLATNHVVMMTAYNANGQQIMTPGASQELRYTTISQGLTPYPTEMFIPGDAITSRWNVPRGTPAAEPGNWTWHISGTGIHSIILSFPEGYDPNVAFARLSYSVECPLP